MPDLSSAPAERAAVSQRRHGIARRLLLGFGAVMLVLVAVGAVALRTTSTLRGTTQESQDAISGFYVPMRELSELLGDVSTHTVEFALAPGTFAGELEEVTALDAEVDETLAALASAEGQDGDPAELAALRSAVANYRDVRDRTIAQAKTDPTRSLTLVAGELHDASEGIHDAFEAYEAAESAEIAAITERADSAVAAGRRNLVILVGLSVLVAALIALLLARRISRNLATVTEAARTLAQGDLAARAEVSSSDETGAIAHAFNQMAGEMETMVTRERAEHTALEASLREFSTFAAGVAEGNLTARLDQRANPLLSGLATELNAMVEAIASMSTEVRGASTDMSTATTQILAAVTQHTAATSEQAASIAQTSITVDEVRATSEQAAHRAEEVAEQAKVVTTVAAEGRAAVDGIMDAMGAIRTTVEKIAADIAALSDQSDAIGLITQTVNELADQSNMLALNATIEAARAGEHGKGFAVVATEVGSLAEQSKAATARVHDILSVIQSSTKAAVLAAEQGTAVVLEGTERARLAGDAIERLNTTIRDTAAAASAIAASAREQHNGMDQIAQAINDVATTTNQIASGVSNTQAAAESLRELAEQLSGLTRRYRLDTTRETRG